MSLASDLAFLTAGVFAPGGTFAFFGLVDCSRAHLRESEGIEAEVMLGLNGTARATGCCDAGIQRGSDACTVATAMG